MDNLSKNIFTTQNLVKQNDLVGDVTEEEIDSNLILVDFVKLFLVTRSITMKTWTNVWSHCLQSKCPLQLHHLAIILNNTYTDAWFYIIDAEWGFWNSVELG